jgi:beta-lactamase regulating signal transducer with metallopeptidase domain
MTNLSSWVLSCLANSLWQVPLLFAAGWIAARLSRSLGPAAEHRVWVGVLLLQSLLPSASVASWQWVRAIFDWPSRWHPGDGVVSVVMGQGRALGSLPLPRFSLAALAAAYGGVCLWMLARFAWRCAGLRAIRRDAIDLPDSSEAARCCARCANRLGLQGISVASSARVFSPVVLGFRRRTILLPASMLPRLTEPDLEAVIGHECAHLLRNDFLMNLLYEALTIPIGYHPLLWATRERLTETREMVCDHLAAAGSGRKQYARSLLRLATVLIDRTPVNTCHAIGIFDANTFERRLMRLSEKPIKPGRARRAALVVACAVLGVAVCTSAFALRVRVNTLNFATLDSEKPTKPIAVSAEVMAKQRISGPHPEYPADAKEARIEGIVVLAVRIGTDGTVESLHVVSGPPELLKSAIDDVEQWTGQGFDITSNSALQKSAIEAVKQWTYKPFLLNGDPVEVDTTVNVVFHLAN